MMAHILLVGGPFDGETAMLVPPDIAAPIQVVWSGWMPWGFDAWLYHWHGERTSYDLLGPVDCLVFRTSGRHLGPDEIPPIMADDAETWVDATILLASIRPGL